MQIPIQEKIAELERRIAKLEQWHDGYFVRRTTTTETGPMTAEQQGHLSRMWQSFDATFEHLRKVFR